jgi:metallo-beta-lactamase domain protein
MFFTGDYLIKDEPVITRLPGGNSEEYHKIGLKLLANIPTHALIYPGHGMSYRLTSKDRVNYGL